MSPRWKISISVYIFEDVNSGDCDKIHIKYATLTEVRGAVIRNRVKIMTSWSHHKTQRWYTIKANDN